MLSRRHFIFVGTTALALIRLTRLSAGATGSQGAFEIVKSDEQWRRELTTEQYAVLRRHLTEGAGTSPLDKEYRAGNYLCAGCDLPLFSSDTKFDSGAGWPSFWGPIDGAIRTTEERSFFFLAQTEVHCRRCGSHLGHVFNDGPQPTGLHCMNGVALKFVPGLARRSGDRVSSNGSLWH
jgi:peptide-methionine (R)-S-oxide reductase